MVVSIRRGVVVVVILAAASGAVGCGTVTGGRDGAAGQDADTPDVPTTIDAPAGQDATGADADADECTIKINEVQTGGATALDEFIELYNTCPDRAFSLAGHSLVYRAATGAGDFPRVTFTVETIAAGKPYFVCANSGFAGTADAHYTDGLALDGGGLALRGPDGNIVDAVGWGSAANAFVETAPAAAPAAAQSIARQPDGHDSDDNAHDFEIAATPSPGASN
ncbi:MAG TPA: lamin tail domain-containing protein [Polyangia bacterium]|jgi:hypothetical protein